MRKVTAAEPHKSVQRSTLFSLQQTTNKNARVDHSEDIAIGEQILTSKLQDYL